MSLVMTAKEWIEDLQKLDPNMKLVGNLYNAHDLRDEIENNLCSAENTDTLSDDEVIERFQEEYDEDETNNYFESLGNIAANLDEDYEEKHEEDEEDDDDDCEDEDEEED